MRVGFDITVLNEKNRTGIGVYTYNLIKAVLKEDRKNEYILFGFSTLETYNYLKSLDLAKFPNVSIKVVKIPARSFRTLFLIWQKLGTPLIEWFIGKVDVYHSFNFYLPPQKKGIKVATVFDMTSIKFPELHHKRTSELDKVRIKEIGEKADLVISISESAKKDFLKEYPKALVEVVYPAVSEDFYSTNVFSKKILEKYGVSGDYFISVATLEPRKNLEFLIKTFLKHSGSEKLVLVGGSGWKNEGLMEIIEKNKDRIIMTGFIEDTELKSLYKNALCLVYPSLYEGFGIPILEALTLGIPVICSNTSSMPEVGGKAVLYIDPSKEDELLEALEKIATDKNLRARMSKEGLIQAKRFSYKKSAEKLLGVYKKLVTSN